MVTPALLVDAGPSAHFSTADQKNLVLQTTGFQVLNEHAYGMIEGLSGVIHALGHGGVVFVGMHVPNEIRGHAYEARSALGQPAGEQGVCQESLRGRDSARGCSNAC